MAYNDLSQLPQFGLGALPGLGSAPAGGMGSGFGQQAQQSGQLDPALIQYVLSQGPLAEALRSAHERSAGFKGPNLQAQGPGAWMANLANALSNAFQQRHLQEQEQQARGQYYQGMDPIIRQILAGRGAIQQQPPQRPEPNYVAQGTPITEEMG